MASAQPARLFTPTVCWSPAAANELRRLAIAGLLALPRRGIETGGLLLGSVTGRPPHHVSIEDVCEIVTEHRSGPGFMLSLFDHERLRDLLARLRAGGDLCVVGYYRTHTAPGRLAELDQADRELIDMYFSDPSHVFLAVRPWSPTRCAARLYRWAGSEVLATGDPFELGQSTPPVDPPPLPPRQPLGFTPAPSPYEPPPPEPQPLQPAPSLHSSPRGHRTDPVSWMAALGFVLAMFSLLLADLPRPARTSHVDAAPSLAMEETTPPPARALPVAAPVQTRPPAIARKAVAVEPPTPDVPASILNRLEAPIDVPVRLRIDESGSVVSAQTTNHPDGLRRYLAAEAARAARAMRFRPALDAQGHPVPSSAQILVPFIPR